jgi:hypothetical protein
LRARWPDYALCDKRGWAKGFAPYIERCPMPDCGGTIAYNGWSKKHGTEAWRQRRAEGAQLAKRLERSLLS